MRFPLAAAAFLALAACNQNSGPELAADHAVVKLPPIAGRPGAAYFTLRSERRDAQLASITSPAVGRIEAHGSAMSGGMMRMEQLKPDELRFGPGRPLEFKPGAKHAMLFEISPELKRGGTTTLDFKLADGRTLSAQAQILGAGDPMPH